jgi:hypothetical protein
MQERKYLDGNVAERQRQRGRGKEGKRGRLRDTERGKERRER